MSEIGHSMVDLIILFDESGQLSRLHHSRLSPDDLTALKQEQGRNGLHIVLHGQRLLLVYIYFDNTGFVTHTGFHILQYRMHGFARATPCGIEIDKD